jgi:pyridoxine kinase
LKILHTVYSVAHVVISSIPLKPWLTSALPSTITHDITPFSSEEYLLCVSSSKIADDGMSSIQACAVPCLPGYFSGVGDLFSALVLAQFDPTHSPAQPPVTDTALSIATSLALTKTHAILSLTYQHVQNLPEQDRTITDDELDSLDPTRKIRRMKGRELRIIQGQDLLRKGKDDTYESFRLMKPWVNFWTQT